MPTLVLVLSTALVLAGCAGKLDGKDVQAGIAEYAYLNEPVGQGDVGLRAGLAGAAIASSDMPWRVPVPCRRAYRAWLSAQPHLPAQQGDFLAQGDCNLPPKDVFIGVAITGGGNKSAVYAAEVLFELERYGLAQHIDVLSSVSGGSFTAALYAVSCDKADGACTSPAGAWTRPVWDYKTISERLEANYLLPFLGRRMLPNHLYLNATTHHGSADDMADIVGNRLLEERGRRLLFSDLNPQRPNLILNATNVTQGRAALDQDSGVPEDFRRPLSDDEALHFSFTQQYFWRLLSRLDSYPLADAVVASAAFPLLIDRPSLRVYRPDDLTAFATGQQTRPPAYVSLYDGGVHDNFGLTELRWFVECHFGRNARRATWTPDIRQRICGQRQEPAVRPGATLVLGINSSLLRSIGVSPDLPKPRSWDSYLGPLRLLGTADSVDLIMAASGEMRKMELRSLIEEVSRATAGPLATPATNPFLAAGRHQYVDIDIEAAHYLSCPGPIGEGLTYKGYLGSERVLNSATGATERRRCEALQGILDWQARRGLALPEAPGGFCSRDDCPELDKVVGDRTFGKRTPVNRDDLFIGPGGVMQPRLLSNQLLFEAVRDVPTSFELSAHYVRLLRYVARWAVARRIWELCADHRDMLDRLPSRAGPACDERLPPRQADDGPGRG